MAVSLREALTPFVEKDISIPDDLALRILQSSDASFAEILDLTYIARKQKFKDSVSLCSIVSIRSGPCSEDCRFCAQSGRYASGAAMPLAHITRDELESAYRNSEALGCDHFSPVASGRRLGAEALDRLCGWIESIEGHPSWCASLGCLEFESFEKLRKAGVRRYHHNLESARTFFPQVCSSHTFADRIETLRKTREAGLEICSGGVVGLGESLEQRVEFARILQEEAVDCIPLNFLLPVAGTPLEDLPPPTPGDILRMIAMMSLVCPAAELRVAAGRSLLGKRQSDIFRAGATGFMICDFLTVKGPDARDDLDMIEASGLTLSD
ncbi:MAG: biotin synthase BioB [Candidatus Sumerlaeota bacterium]